MLPNKFRVKCPFSSREEAKIRFSRWPPWWPSWVSDRNNFCYVFLIYKSLQSFQPRFKSIGLSVQEKWKIDFQDCPIVAILDFQSEWFYLIFIYFFSTSHPDASNRVNWPFGPGEEEKNRFSRLRSWRPSWISERNYFSYFWPTSHPDTSYQVSSPLAFLVQEKKQKIDFQDGPHCHHLGFLIGRF